ncbi:MAG: hypothetical protein JJU19_08105 [Pararhodobacter sp.]|nr:hypothetical protein [Pararhodobacter sp.]
MPSTPLPAPTPGFRATFIALASSAFLGLTHAPALASTPAKAAWDTLRETATQAGLRIAAQGIDMDGDALILESVLLTPIRGTGGTTLSLSTLRIDPQDDGRVALTPSADGQIALATPLGDMLHFTTRHDGVLSYLPAGTDDDPRLVLTVAFAHLGLTPVPSPDGASPQADRAAIGGTVDGIAGEIQVTHGAEISLAGRLTLDAFAYTLDQEQTFPIRTRQSGDARASGVTLEFDLLRLDLLAQDPALPLASAFDGGMRLDMSIAVTESDSRTQQQSPFLTMDLDSDAGLSTLSMTLADGIFAIDADGQDLRLDGLVNGQPFGLTGQTMAFGMQVPLLPDEALQQLGAQLSLRGFSLTPESLAELNAGSLAGELADIAFATSAQLRLHAELFDPDLAAPPVDLSGITLERLMFRLGAARLDGEGSLELDPDSPFTDDGMVNGAGTFTFDLQGGEALLTALGHDGFLTGDQMFFARMMMGMLGRSMGPDHLRSEVSIAPGGQVLLNGLPLPF